MLRLFAFTSETKDASRRVNEAADEEALRRSFSSRILADFGIESELVIKSDASQPLGSSGDRGSDAFAT